MGKKQSKVESFLVEAGALAEGEVFIAAAKAMPLGGIMKNAKSSSYFMFGAVGAVAASIVDKRGPEPAEVEAKLKKGAYVALTSTRLLLLSIGGMSSSPREIAAAIDRSAIQKTELGTTRVAMVKLPTLTVTFGPEDSLEFEFAKPDAKDAEELYRAMQ